MSYGRNDQHRGASPSKVSRRESKRIIAEAMNAQEGVDSTFTLVHHDLSEINRKFADILRTYTFLVTEPPVLADGKKAKAAKLSTKGQFYSHERQYDRYTLFCCRFREFVGFYTALDRELGLTGIIDRCRSEAEAAIQQESDGWEGVASIQRQMNKVYYEVTQAVNKFARPDTDTGAT